MSIFPKKNKASCCQADRLSRVIVNGKLCPAQLKGKSRRGCSKFCVSLNSNIQHLLKAAFKMNRQLRTCQIKSEFLHFTHIFFFFDPRFFGLRLCPSRTSSFSTKDSPNGRPANQSSISYGLLISNVSPKLDLYCFFLISYSRYSINNSFAETLCSSSVKSERVCMGNAGNP